MEFTGKNIEIVVQALQDAIDQCYNEIGLNTGDLGNERYIVECEVWIATYTMMLERIYKRRPDLRPHD